MSEGSMVLRMSKPDEEPVKVTLSNGNLLIGKQSGYNLPLLDAMVWTLAWPTLAAAPNSPCTNCKYSLLVLDSLSWKSGHHDTDLEKKKKNRV